MKNEVYSEGYTHIPPNKTVSRIDYDLLQKQHAELIKLLWALPDHVLWGLVDLIEDMLDENERQEAK